MIDKLILILKNVTLILDGFMVGEIISRFEKGKNIFIQIILLLILIILGIILK